MMASTQGSVKVDQSAIEAYRHGRVRSQASRDPLLSSEGKGDNSRSRDSSYWNQSATKRPASKAPKASPQPIPTSQTSAESRKEKLRKYQEHRGSNRFFLCGLIMTSDDNPVPFLASLVVMVVLPVLWFIFVAPFTWHHISPAPVIIFAYIWAVAASSMW